MTDTPADQITLANAPVVTDALHNIGMIALALVTGMLHSNPSLGWAPEVLTGLGSVMFAGLSAVHVAKTSFFGRILSTLSPVGFSTATA
jgi:hypothetical protein